MPKELFIGKIIAEVMPKVISKLAYKNLKSVFESRNLRSFEYKLINKRIEVYCEIRMVKKGECEVLAMLRAITRRKTLDNNFEYLSFNDQLTGVKTSGYVNFINS